MSWHETLAGAERLSLNTELFYSDHSNYQMQGLPFFSGDPIRNLNASAATIKGIEWI